MHVQKYVVNDHQITLEISVNWSACVFICVCGCVHVCVCNVVYICTRTHTHAHSVSHSVWCIVCM